MIYIIYGLSGPLKRVLIDPIIDEKNKNSLNVTINKRGILGKTLQDYDYSDENKKNIGQELIICHEEEDLIRECGERYRYKYHDYEIAINQGDIEKSLKNNEKHIIICHDLCTIKKIKEDYSNTQLIKISFYRKSEILKVACTKYNDDFEARVKRIAEIIDNIEFTDVKHNIEIFVKTRVNKYEEIGSCLCEKLFKKINSQWHKLLNSQRFREEPNDDFTFEQDFNRVINSAAFRRLQDKAQVFPLEKNDYPRTRLTHSIECSAIAEELGIRALQIIKEKPDFLQSCYKIPTILKTAALLHDMGNPPFGHFGEDVIRDWFEKQSKKQEVDLHEKLKIIFEKKEDGEYKHKEYVHDFLNFEGNAQLFRLITNLDKVDDNYRINLTNATLAVVLKYLIDSSNINKQILFQKKLGYFTSETEIFDKVQKNVNLNGQRHPLTFLLEAADDISYLTSDLQDAHHKKLISWQDIERAFNDIITDNKEYEDIKKTDDEKIRLEKFHSFLRKKLIKDVITAFEKNYEDIMNYKFEKELIKESDSASVEKIIREEFLEKKVYLDDTICRSQIMANTILTKLLDTLIPAVLDYQPEEDKKIKSKMNALNQRVFCLLSDNYKKVLNNTILSESMKNKDSEDPEVIYHKLLLATDYICGMTDSYAQQMYNMIVAHPLDN